MLGNTIKYLLLTIILILFALPSPLSSGVPEPIHGPEPLKTLEEMLDFYFGEHADLMYAIALCESGGRQFEPTGEVVTSHTGDYGILQINDATWQNEANRLGLDYKNSMHDNIRMAKHVYEEQGLTAWTVYKNGCYKKHL